jgi:hypothetical protein
MSNIKKNIITPIGEFTYVRVTTPTQIDPASKPQYSCSLTIKGAEAEKLKTEIDYLFKENFPNKQPSTLGYKEVDGGYVFKFRTNAYYGEGEDKKEKKIKLVDKYNDSLDEGIMIGDGSTGRVNASIAPYTFGKKVGMSLYLNGVQIKDLILYNGGGFEALEDKEDGFTPIADSAADSTADSEDIPW